MQKRIEEAYNLAGLLYKKSPNKFTGWQKRYFKVSGQGSMLCYYKKQPSGTENASGAIKIHKIESIQASMVNSLLFSIHQKERQFELKAETKEQRDLWVETLTFLKELRIKDMKNKGEIDDDGDGKVDWKQLDENTKNLIKLEEEKKQYEKDSDKIWQQNEQVLRDKGIYPILSQYSMDIIDKYVMCGFLMKKGALNKVTVAKKRWFLLIASVPINGEMADNDKIKLPDVLKHDQIFYFKYDQKGDTSQFIKKINLDQCDKPQIMNLDKNQFLNAFKLQKLPYGFTLFNTQKNRDFNFFSDRITEVNKWVDAIKAVQARPNKGDKRKTKISLVNGVEKEVEVDEETEQLIYSEIVEKKQGLIWKEYTLQLKEQSISWNEQKSNEDSQNSYIILFNIKKVEARSRMIEITTKDNKEFVFKADTDDKAITWEKKIQEQIDSVKSTVKEEDLSSEVQLVPSDNKPTKSDEEEESEEDVLLSFQKKMEFEISQNPNSDSLNENKKGFFSNLFFCCTGGNDLDSETDRGF